MVSDSPGGTAAGGRLRERRCAKLGFCGIIVDMNARSRFVRAATLSILLFLATGARAATLLVFGDSISAGYGVDTGKGWVALLADRLKQPPYAGWTVVNASLSGETTSGGLSRLPAALAQYQPQLVLIELGGNDGLRAQPLSLMRANLLKMVQLCQAAHAPPVIMEMRIPSNYGPDYTDGFRAVFGDVAGQTKAPLLPFFMLGIAGDPAHWFQADGIHPNEAAQPKLLDAVWPTLEPLVAVPTEGKFKRR